MSRQIDSVSKLRQIEGDATMPSLALNGYVAPGSGGGGRLVWTPDTQSADDGGTIFVPTKQPRRGCWKRERTDGLTISDFGAERDRDSTDAIQRMIDSLGAARFPTSSGSFYISRPLRVGTGQSLIGHNRATAQLRTTDGFDGTEMVSLVGAHIAQNVHIEGLSFWSQLPGVAAIRHATGGVGNSTFARLGINTLYGLKLDGYTQACTVRDLLHWDGKIEQLLSMAGNQNTIDGLDIEGTGGGVTDCPLVHIHGCMSEAGVFIPAQATALHDVLLEGEGSAHKTPLCIEDALNLTLERPWFESTTTNGTLLAIKNCGHVEVMGGMCLGDPARKIKIENTREVEWYNLNINGAHYSLDDIVDIDETSHLTVHLLTERYPRGSGRNNVTVLNPASFQRIELGGQTLAFASSPPTTGAWKRGDRVFSSLPTPGQPKGWVYTGSEWESEGNL